MPEKSVSLQVVGDEALKKVIPCPACGRGEVESGHFGIYVKYSGESTMLAGKEITCTLCRETSSVPILFKNELEALRARDQYQQILANAEGELVMGNCPFPLVPIVSPRLAELIKWNPANNA